MKFKRLCRCIPKSFTDFSMEAMSVPIENPTGVSSDLFLVKIIDLNLSGLAIILLLENQFIAASDSSLNAFVRSLGISDFRISGQSLIKENCHNSRTSDDIDMKLRPVTKLDNRNKKRQKNLTLTSCRKILTSLSFFGFLANSEQCGGRIADTESAKVMFSVIVTFLLSCKN